MFLLYFGLPLVVVVFGTIYFKLSGIKVFILSLLPTTVASIFILFSILLSDGFRGGAFLGLLYMPFIIYFYLFPILLSISFLTILIEKKFHIKLNLLILINYLLSLLICLAIGFGFDKKCIFIAIFMPMSLYILKTIEQKRRKYA